MQNRLFAAILTVLISAQAFAAQPGSNGFFTGQDLYLTADNMSIVKIGPGTAPEHTMVFQGGFSLSIGANQLSGDRAVVWLRTQRLDYRGGVNTSYDAVVYLESGVSVIQGSGARTTGLSQSVIEQGEAVVIRFIVSGQVFATADKKTIVSSDELGKMAVYQKATTAVRPLRSKPRIAEEAMVPSLEEKPAPSAKPPKKPWRISDIFKMKLPQLPEPKPEPEKKPPQRQYPLNIVGLWGPVPIETSRIDGRRVGTVIGQFYLWQKRDDKDSLLEFQADSAVIFFSDNQEHQKAAGKTSGTLQSDEVEAVYLAGNIMMTEAGRTIRADEIYYDFQKSHVLAVRAEVRNFDSSRDVPIYVRAAKLRQVSENVFDAEDVTVTTSEFYLPQVSLNASRMVLTDTTGIDERTTEKPDKGRYDAILYDVAMKMGKHQIFGWPKIRTNFERPDIALRKLSVGSDSDFGTAVESRWYLSRLLGLKEPEGVDSDLGVDYFSKRGVGAGLDIEYERPDYFGDVTGYMIRDRGEDDLGRTSDRKNLEPESDLRGRASLRHRHLLPYDWQATIEASYLSDRNFYEAFYRDEFETAKSQETLLHLKRIKDNWAFSFLSTVRINDFMTQTEELPTVEFHLKGASFWQHRLTYYSDTQISRLRDRFPSDSTSTDPQQFYTFVSTRHEVDMPFMWDKLKLVPFVAGTYGFEDQTYFRRRLDGTAVNGDDSVLLGEAGLRMATMFYKQDEFVRSRLWDLNGIRHIIVPHAEGVLYKDSEKTVETHDIANVGISQRWQTRRGPKDNLRTVDWMRLDIDATWLKDAADASVGPARFIYNDPAIPISLRRNAAQYGILRDSINTDYTWRLSDTATLLSDMNYDIKSGLVQQLNVGFLRYVYPNISYYIGSRYLQPVVVTVPADGVNEKGSNSLVGAVTYALNERYTATFSQEYNVDYGKNVKSELTILRRYHRMYYGLTLSTDESLERNSIVFSIWPQGVKELALGSRRYIGLVGSSTQE